MNIRYAGKSFTNFRGGIYLQKVNDSGLVTFEYDYPEDFAKLVFLARNHYKIKTRKKRIVKKYLAKFLNEALRKFVEANRER